ncbi:MAG: quinone-dependent dihydroorotate dehydrogenase [Herpetosiphon sp.]
MFDWFYRRLLFPAACRFEAEQVHDATMHLLALAGRSPLLLGLLRRRLLVDDPRLSMRLWNLQFTNPLGVAAGLDKKGVAATALYSLGFGHVEVGTVTPREQPGNPRPRIFRLPPDQAMINRMGFPGPGAAAVRTNLGRSRGARPVIGINIGANKATVEAGQAADDYCAGIRAWCDRADYITINISSPNTARLRDLQGKDALTNLLRVIVAERGRQPRRPPLLVKIAPDLLAGELDDLLAVVVPLADGLVIANTTLVRPATLRGAVVHETGGLSGRPLTARSTELIRTVYAATGGRLPVIGVGGVFDVDDAWQKICAGASLVQVYTGFVYGGPLTAAVINRGLQQRLHASGAASIGDVVGSG